MGKPRKKIRKDGTRVYEIRVTVNKVPYSTTYIPPATWSDNKAMKEAEKRTTQLETDARAGLVRNRKQEREYQAQLAVEQAKRPTFERYTQMYLESRKNAVSANTLENYRVVFRRAAPTLNKYLLEDITPAIMREYVTRLQGEGENLKTGELVRHRTVEKHFKILKKMFDSAVDDEIIPVSPMQKIKCPKPRKDEEIREREAFSESEVKHILDCANKEPLRWKAMLIFALDSGCRRGEIIGLKWEDIDFTSGKLTVSRNAQYTAGKGTYTTTPKNGKPRTFGLNSQALEVLKEWRREQLKTLLALGLPRTGFVFTDEHGQMMNPQAPTSYLSRFGKKYGIDHINPHKLRHTMATLMIANGADIKSVSEKLGHADASITLNVYTHRNEEAMSKANEIYANAIYKQA